MDKKNQNNYFWHF